MRKKEKDLKNCFSIMKILRAKDLISKGFHPEDSKAFVEDRILHKIGHGLYRLEDDNVSSFYSFAVISLRVPNSVICLNSALLFYDIGNQMPHSTWFAIPNRNAKPRISEIPIRIFRFSKLAYSSGIEEHKIDGIPIKIYSIEKTIADCFKYRNVIGLEVAVEALKDGISRKKIQFERLQEYSIYCRVSNIMKSYIEALV